MYTFFSVLTALLFAAPSAQGALTTADDIAAAYSLTVSTTLPFPTSTLSSSGANDFVISSWNLNRNKVQNKPDALAFVNDPFSNSSSSSTPNVTSPVMQVTYQNGTFGGTGGGVQFLSLFNGSISPQTMLLSYDVAFDQSFQFVKGGKLPGLRGGTDNKGCEGGSQPNGTNCWSTRLMWRTSGVGEAYAYIPDSNNLCSEPDIVCNSDFGTSIGRGSFSFVTNAWNRITLLVQLNNPGSNANGVLMLYYNDVQAIQKTNLQFRTNSNVLASGLFFSTFFGGNDSSWATPTTQHSFYRNFRLWASESPSNVTGQTVTTPNSNSRGVYRYGGKWTDFWWIEVVCITTVVLIYRISVL